MQLNIKRAREERAKMVEKSFRIVSNETDLLQYQGQAYDVIFMEECTQFPEIVFTTMTESNRSSGLMQEAFTPRMYFTCNPGGVGHAWFKRLFVDRQYRGKERPEDYIFIQASVYDNPWLLTHSPDYVRALENLPDDRKRAMLYGDWNVFEGQYFPEFQRETHVCAPFTVPAHWRRFRVFDYGFDMFACYFVAMDEDGRAWFYREIYEGRDKCDEHGNPGKGLRARKTGPQGIFSFPCAPYGAREIHLMSRAAWDGGRINGRRKNSMLAVTSITCAAMAAAVWGRLPVGARAARNEANALLSICRGLHPHSG